MDIVIIAAVAANGVIGRDGSMPWSFSEDLKHFKAVTTGSPVIMGRRTFESVVDRLGRPLPDRTNIVLSRGSPTVPGNVRLAASIDEAIEVARDTGADAAYVIGGGTVYEQFLPDADRMILTEIDEDYPGDTWFPELDRSDWFETDRIGYDSFSIATYIRRSAADQAE